MRSRRTARVASLVVGATLTFITVACSSARLSTPVHNDAGTDITIASYDFAESVLLAQMYGIALQSRGYRVHIVPELGSREVVDPALIQGQVDVVPEYVGAALTFLTGAAVPGTTNAARVHAQLSREFAGHGVATLHSASATDENGFVVSRAAAERHGWSRISDLVTAAPTLVFGGPPECVERDLCLGGLRTTYGLRFKEFRPFSDQSVTAQALLTGEIDVGLLDTTNGALSDNRLLLLRDDRHLQPAQNVVPVVTRAAEDRAGPALAATLDALSARLTTADLVALNRAVDVGGRSPRTVADQWLRTNGMLTGPN